MSYSSPLTETITYEHNLITFEETILTIKAPPGMTGRLVRMSATLQGPDITGAPAVYRVGNSGDPDAYGSLTVPLGNVPASNFDRGAVDRIPLDDLVELSEAGDSDFNPVIFVVFVIEWS